MSGAHEIGTIIRQILKSFEIISGLHVTRKPLILMKVDITEGLFLCGEKVHIFIEKSSVYNFSKGAHLYKSVYFLSALHGAPFSLAN